jgi:DNA excision repair protein ERCC-2
VAETPASFLQHLKEVTFIERKPMQYVNPMYNTLARSFVQHFSLRIVTGFVQRGFHPL